MRSWIRGFAARGQMSRWVARGRTSVVGRLIGSFLRQSRTAAGIVVWIGISIVLGIIIVAIFAPFLAPFDPNTKVGAVEAPPGGPFFMGTDRSGEEVFSPALYGARIAPSIVAVATTPLFVLGLPLGLLSGSAGGPLDRALVPLVDWIFGF